MTRKHAAPGAANRVRITGGIWRSRNVDLLAHEQLRPTADRVRQTLFNWLGQTLEGMRCLDLFAGSGALGFEALSRGAERVVMVERSRASAAKLQENAGRLRAQGLEIIQGEALAYVRRCQERFDVVFLDPPFATDCLADVLPPVGGLLAPGGVVYVESAPAFAFGPEWSLLKSSRAGQVKFQLLILFIYNGIF